RDEKERCRRGRVRFFGYEGVAEGDGEEGGVRTALATNRFRYWSVALASVALSSCIGDYVPPISGETAKVRFTTPHVITNNPIMIHTDKCSELDALLVGRLHSKTFGDTYRD